MWTHPEPSHTLPGLIVLIYGDNSDGPGVMEGLQLVFKQSQRDGMQEARVQAAIPASQDCLLPQEESEPSRTVAEPWSKPSAAMANGNHS